MSRESEGSIEAVTPSDFCVVSLVGWNEKKSDEVLIITRDKGNFLPLVLSAALVIPGRPALPDLFGHVLPLGAQLALGQEEVGRCHVIVLVHIQSPMGKREGRSRNRRANMCVK